MACERERESATSTMTIPKCLKYQLEDKCDLKISDQCCTELKKKPIKQWELNNNRSVAITGMRKEEGGTRTLIQGCVLTDKQGHLKKFHPLLVVDDDWEETFIKANNINVCDLYKPPYNFKRTGCKFCPFSLDLAEQLETARRLLPNEAMQGEIIWKQVFDEYRRIGYRLRKVEQMKLF